jgi:hypothetical protein
MKAVSLYYISDSNRYGRDQTTNAAQLRECFAACDPVVKMQLGIFLDSNDQKIDFGFATGQQVTITRETVELQPAVKRRRI